jgi:ABC-2 type transport system ATP-binding protein
MAETRHSGGSRADREVLRAVKLQKSYGPRPALRGLSFTLRAGRILGFLGPNGAGKTTAIRILTTILEPDAGHFVVDGLSSGHPDQIRRRIGVLPESLGFPKNMTGKEYVTYFGRLYGLSAAAAKAKAGAMLEAVGLEQRSRSLIGTYSRGMRQRLGIARALINDPAVVFLDEPTLGLDPQGQQELLKLVVWIARERHAGVVLCSHQLTDVESVCDDVVILSTGEVVAQGPVADVIGGVQKSAVRISVPPDAVPDAVRVLEGAAGVVRATSSGGSSGWVRVEFAESGAFSPNGQHANNVVLGVLIEAKIPVLGFQAGGGRLQDVFLQITQGGIE